MKENQPLILSRIKRSVTLGICAIAGVLILAACNQPASGGVNAPEYSFDVPPYISPYDWEELSFENGRFAYHEQGEQVSRTGIDVSSHQGSIDWQLVAADGIEFAFIRLGYRGYSEGLVHLDEFFEGNYSGASEAGLPVGVYFFSQALNEEEAREEAQFVLDQLQGRVLQYPIVYDFEPVFLDGNTGRANNINSQQRTSNALAFCEHIEAAGYPTMIYGNAKDIAAYDLNVLGERPVWFAEYDAATPGGQFDFVIWQYSSTGQVTGIATNVDLNIELVHRESR